MNSLIIDFIGTCFSLSCTYLLVHINPLGWPIGLIANTLNIYLFYGGQLYGNCLVELYFFISTLYGWYHWKKLEQNSGDQKHSVFYLSNNAALITLIAIGSTTLGLYTLLLNTDSTTPFLDSITTAISIFAQILLTRRFLETWYLWFITDAIYVGLYSLKGFPFHAIMMAIFLGLAIKGAKQWNKLARQDDSLLSVTPQQINDSHA